jgi:hypothetical protein
MKSNVWTVVALVTGIAGFFTGYAVSGYTGARVGGRTVAEQKAAAKADAGAAAQKADAGGYGAPEPAKAPAAAPKPQSQAAAY